MLPTPATVPRLGPAMALQDVEHGASRGPGSFGKAGAKPLEDLPCAPSVTLVLLEANVAAEIVADRDFAARHRHHAGTHGEPAIIGAGDKGVLLADQDVPLDLFEFGDVIVWPLCAGRPHGEQRTDQACGDAFCQIVTKYQQLFQITSFEMI